MRRIASSLVASIAIATLAACSSGGYGIGTSTTTVPSTVQFTNGSGQVNDFILAPSGNAPVMITATGETNSGEVVPFATFTWTAAFAPAGSRFLKGPSPNGFTACGTPPETPAVPILQSGTAGPAFPLYGGAYSYYYPGHSANTVFIGVPLDPTTLAPVQPSANGSYCLVVDVTNSAGLVVGSQIVAVTNTAT